MRVRGPAVVTQPWQAAAELLHLPSAAVRQSLARCHAIASPRRAAAAATPAAAGA